MNTDEILIPGVIIYANQRQATLHIQIPQALTTCTLSEFVGQEGSLCSLRIYEAEIQFTRQVAPLLQAQQARLCPQCVRAWNEWLRDITLEGEAMHFLQLDGTWGLTAPQIRRAIVAPRTDRQKPLRVATRAW